LGQQTKRIVPPDLSFTFIGARSPAKTDCGSTISSIEPQGTPSTAQCSTRPTHCDATITRPAEVIARLHFFTR